MAKLVAVTRGEPPKARSNGQLGKYRLVATLGQGGMGTVHLAYASGLGQFRKLLVVKELRQDLVWKDTSVAMFIDEARLAARLDHPNVVQTFEADQDDGRYFIAMEYLDGQPLSALMERMRAQGGLPLALHLHVLCEVLNGLHYAHELRDYDGSLLQVVHRDVSPQNVFVTFHGQVKVVDFGVAKARNASTSTTPGVFKGKFAYAAPEQALGRPVDARADVFAVGVMLWEALAGRRYSDQNPTPESFQARLSGAEPSIRQIVPGVDPALARICDRALAHEPTDRYRTALAMREDLQRYLHGLQVRVDAAQLAALMQQAFQRERVAMLRIVERAMRQQDVSSSDEVTAPPTLLLHVDGGKEMTLVADLTDLAEVSHHADDNQIRASYEVSKVTRVTPAGSTGVPKPSRLLWIGLGVSLAAASLSIWVWHAGQSEPSPARESNVASAPGRDKPAGPAQTTHAQEPSAPGGPAAPTIAVTPGQGERRRAAPAPVAKPRPSVNRRERSAAAAGRPKPEPEVVQAQAPRPVPPVQAEPAKPAEPSMGSDLSTTRRAPGGRIDVEDPYQ